jgi:peptidoglycan/LPS O-acetylase OafA/YrhL
MAPAFSSHDGPVPVKNFRTDIQGLRAVAVLLVVFAHAGFAGFDGGFVGVDVFFVISGYVITSLLMRQPARHVMHNLRHFYARRVLRIVPAATVVIVATVFAAYFIQGEYFDPTLLEDARWATFFSANFRLISTTTDYFIQGVEPSLMTHFWSLAVEEQFYFFYPVIVFALTWLGSDQHRVRNLRNFLLIAVATSAAWSVYYTAASHIEAYYSPLTRFWELALGGLVATLPILAIRHKYVINNILALVAVAVLAISVALLSPLSVFPGALAWWPCGAAAVILWTGKANAHGGPAMWLSWKPLTYIGDVSYSFYLWHFGWLMLPKQIDFFAHNSFAPLIQIAGAFICAVISYHFLENPIRHSKRLTKDGVAVAILLLVCLAISWDATLIVEQLYLNS